MALFKKGDVVYPCRISISPYVLQKEKTFLKALFKTLPLNKEEKELVRVNLKHCRVFEISVTEREKNRLLAKVEGKVGRVLEHGEFFINEKDQAQRQMSRRLCF